MSTKICTKCAEEKPLTEFYRHSQKKDGLNPSCKICQRADVAASYRRNPEPAKARAKKWEAENKERCKVRKDTYYTANSEAAKKRARKWAEENKERRSEIVAASAEKHREKRLQKNREYLRMWKERDPDGYREEMRMRSSIRRSRINENGGVNITRECWEAIFEVFGDICVYCGNVTHKLTMDHWMPVSLGGKTEPGNLIPCCKPCNSRKGALHPDEWKKRSGISDERTEGSLTVEQFLEVSREALSEFCS